MIIFNTQTRKILCRIHGGEELTLDSALALSGMETAKNAETGETVWIDADGEENWYEDMELFYDKEA